MNRALAQAGIYTLGVLSKTNTLIKLATIVFYKDITTRVAVAMISRAGENAKGKGIIGHVSYQLVSSVNPFNSKRADDLAHFASVFIGTVKSTMT